MCAVMESLVHRYDVIKAHLTERQRRVWLGAEGIVNLTEVRCVWAV